MDETTKRAHVWIDDARLLEEEGVELNDRISVSILVYEFSARDTETGQTYARYGVRAPKQLKIEGKHLRSELEHQPILIGSQPEASEFQPRDVPTKVPTIGLQECPAVSPDAGSGKISLVSDVQRVIERYGEKAVRRTIDFLAVAD